MKAYETVMGVAGRNALHLAAEAGKTQICKYLFEKLKLDVNSRLLISVPLLHLRWSMVKVEGVSLEEEITKVRRENEARVVREDKERRKRRAEKLNPNKAREDKNIGDAMETETRKESQVDDDLLPDEIVRQLVAREKKVFSSDFEDEQTKKKTASKKLCRLTTSGLLYKK